MIPPRLLLLVAVLFAVSSTKTVHAQEARDHDGHEEHEHHHGLHFSHPLVTESPSPDTKLRLDGVRTTTGDLTETATRLEGEYAFTSALSLAVTVPYLWRSNGIADEHGVGNTELSLKGASLRWGERGVLVGGGLSAGLPTGNDATGIGTSRAVELEPFADLAWKREGLELVGFAHYSTSVRNPSGADAEHEFAFDGSVLQPVGSRIEALLEVELARSSEGQAGATASSLAPGVKLYPFANRALMAGVSALIGMGGDVQDTRGLLVSAFYHF